MFRKKSKPLEHCLFLVRLLENSMKVGVNIPVFSSPATAYASIWGELELPVLPCVDDEVSFVFSGKESMPEIPRFGVISVVGRRFSVGSSPLCFLELSDVVMDDADSAEAMCSYFERQFGFIVDRYLAD
ncbi:hypothetical protein [Marilutibacter maris]|uniref:hypothetical protein n=1 Tax=Marilutibacter maris TaxID=1605891 RepID=UPI001CB9AEA4|nr:hypothetical protein [Lysobacter maris]